jgi:t-SNARE complex subunit (syntaxin)
MPFFTSKQDVQRSTIAALLQGLDSVMPGLVGWLVARPNLEPEALGRQLGENLLAELNRLQSTISYQESQIQALNKSFSHLFDQIHASPTAAMRRELEKTKGDAANLQTQLAKAEQALQELKRQNAQANAQHAQQVAQLQAALADYKRLNARQHLELVDLMGDSYTSTNHPPAELPG